MVRPWHGWLARRSISTIRSVSRIELVSASSDKRIVPKRLPLKPRQALVTSPLPRLLPEPLKLGYQVVRERLRGEILRRQFVPGLVHEFLLLKCEEGCRKVATVNLGQTAGDASGPRCKMLTVG